MVPADLAGTVRRVYYEHILEHLANQREVLLLEGPRRVGKTTHLTRRFSPAARIIVVSRDLHKLQDERTLIVPLRLFLG